MMIFLVYQVARAQNPDSITNPSSANMRLGSSLVISLPNSARDLFLIETPVGETLS